MIGVFDSGIGGLVVVRSLREVLPEHDMVFLADTARSPYANRSIETVARFADEGIRHLIGLKVGLVVICCSAAASAFIQGKIGPYEVPIIDGVTCAVAAALPVSKKHQFGVIGKRAAMESGVYESLIRDQMPDARVYTQSSILLDILIEEGWALRPETARIAKKLLHPLRVRQIDTLIPDSPHLSVIEKKIALKAGRKVNIVKPWQAIADKAKKTLTENPEIDRALGKTGSLKVKVTDLPAGLKEKCEALLKSRVTIECVPTFSEAGHAHGCLRD